MKHFIFLLKLNHVYYEHDDFKEFHAEQEIQYKQQLAKLKKANAKLRKDKAEVISQLNESNSRYDDLKNDYDDLKNDYDQLKNDYDQLTTEHDDFKEFHHEQEIQYKKQLAKLKKANAELKSQVKESNNRCDSINMEHLTTSQELNNLKADYEKLEARIPQVRQNNFYVKEDEIVDDTNYDSYLDFYLRSIYPMIESTETKIVQQDFLKRIGYKVSLKYIREKAVEMYKDGEKMFSVTKINRAGKDYRIKRIYKGFIYIGQLEELKGTNTYKVGRTVDLKARFQTYKKQDGGIKWIATYAVSDPNMAEGDMLAELNAMVKNKIIKKHNDSKKNEYYIGELSTIQNVVIKYAKQYAI